MPYFDRFDVCEAWYIYLSENHGGMGSCEYYRLSKMLTYFHPRPSLQRDTLEENAMAILAQLEAKNAR